MSAACPVGSSTPAPQAISAKMRRKGRRSALSALTRIEGGTVREISVPSRCTLPIAFHGPWRSLLTSRSEIGPEATVRQLRAANGDSVRDVHVVGKICEHQIAVEVHRPSRQTHGFAFAVRSSDLRREDDSSWSSKRRRVVFVSSAKAGFIRQKTRGSKDGNERNCAPDQQHPLRYGYDARFHTPNENKMSDGGRGRVSLGVKVWKSSQKRSVQRSAVRSIAWLGLLRI